MKRQDLYISLHGLKESINIAEMLLSEKKYREAEVFFERARQFLSESELELTRLKIKGEGDEKDRSRPNVSLCNDDIVRS